MLLDDFRATAKACGYGSLRSQGRRKERVRTRHTRLRDLAARFARGLLEISLTLRIGGRREHRVRAAPAVSCANSAQKKRTRAYRFSGGNPAFPAQWFSRLIPRSPRCPGLIATVARAP